MMSTTSIRTCARRAAGAAFLVLASAATVFAQTTTVTLSSAAQINADLTIQGGTAAEVDFSASPILQSKVSSEAYTRRILMKFDTQNSIPANATIQSATLMLVLKKAESGEQRPFTAYHVTRSFTKGQTTWVSAKDGVPWTRRGGDLGDAYGVTQVGTAVGATQTFDITNLVQSAVNGSLGSRYTRLALVDTGANTPGNYREFHSTRAVDPALRPKLVITYGTATTEATPPPPSTSIPTGTTLKVMQWNIHKTKGSDNVCNPDRIASGIAAHKPDIVSLNEVNFNSGECAWTFNMGEKLRALVQSKTGQTWYRQDANGMGEGTRGVGNVILSRYQPVSQTWYQLSNDRAVAQMSIIVNGRVVNVFSTHVEYVNNAWRPVQINEALAWISTFAEPRIVMGDFNTNPGTSDYKLMATPYQDAWAAAKTAGTATAYNGTGATRGGSRFDYVFHSRVAALALQSVNVPDMRVNGIQSSDHAPVIAVFQVR
jgi:endonuclease/exonuclease/phosphatase family metal-dependent hydrolase